MKLRLRSLESKETHRIEVPNTCNLQQLKELIAHQLWPTSSSSSTTVSENLLLSLNRKDELYGSSPQESLSSLGDTSGDLIYYTRNPFAFSSQTPNLSHAHMEKPLETNPRSNQNEKLRVESDENIGLMNTQMVESANSIELIAKSDGTGGLMDTRMEGPAKLSTYNDQSRDLMDTQKLETDELVQSSSTSDHTREVIDIQKEGSSKLCTHNGQTQDLVNIGKDSQETSAEETIGADEMDVDDESVLDENSKFLVPSFFRKVFMKEMGEAASGTDHKLLVIAVHAVLLESGFVSYNPVSGMKVDGFHLPDEWPSSAFNISLHYTLPEFSSYEVIETVVLKFQVLGKFVNVYGSLSTKGFGVHRVCLDEPRFLPALSFVWKMTDFTDSEKEQDGFMKLYPNREIFEFWKIVKDGLSYPLLIDICEKVGLVPPPCFMRLPTELKLKILESLPAVDVARVACVCSELRFISSNDDLWRLKYEEEFGLAPYLQRECQWKARFCSALEIRKKGKRSVCIPLSFREPPMFRPVFPGQRDPNPFGPPPFIIGGDYDRFPGLGIPHNYSGRRIFRWNCDLGEFNP